MSLPSSKGPASKSNLAVAQVIESALNDNVSSAHLMHLIQRFQPMAWKSTMEDRNIRRSRDAPRIMHYDLEISKNTRYRDACYLGDIQDGIKELVNLLGWQDDLSRLIKE